MGTRARKHRCEVRRYLRSARRGCLVLLCAGFALGASAEEAALHYQATVAVQAHPSFEARYSGRNSMQPDAESATSVVMDLSGGLRLWQGAEAWVQPELAGGRGLSSTLGIAAFPSGEVYRVGNPEPTIVLARVFLQVSAQERINSCFISGTLLLIPPKNVAVYDES